MPVIYEPDAVLGFRYRPSSSDRMIRFDEIDNVVTINSMGYHDGERDLTDTRMKRFVAVGDSLTACLEVPVEKTWTRLFEKSLQDHGSDSQVINLGLDGTGTDVHLRILERYLDRYSADLVLLPFYENDLDDSLYSTWFRECYGQYVLLYQTLTQKERIIERIETSSYTGSLISSLYSLSYTVRVLINLIDPHNLLWNNLVTPLSLSPPPPLAKVPAGDHRLKEYMRSFLELANAHGFVFVVAPVPCSSDPSKSERILREALAGDSVSEKISILDIARPLQATLTAEGREYKEMFWKYDNHFSDYGNQVFARAVDRALKDAGLI
jgi:lysophospholipase L1-like esterase